MKFALATVLLMLCPSDANLQFQLTEQESELTLKALRFYQKQTKLKECEEVSLREQYRLANLIKKIDTKLKEIITK